MGNYILFHRYYGYYLIPLNNKEEFIQWLIEVDKYRYAIWYGKDTTIPPTPEWATRIDNLEDIVIKDYELNG